MHPDRGILPRNHLEDACVKLDHLVILVSNLEASLPFYEALFTAVGWTKSRPHVWVDDTGIMVDIKQATDLARPYGRFAPGLNHMGVTAPDRAAVEAVARAMAAAGFEVPEIEIFDADEALFLKDPDGMRIEVTSYGTATRAG